MASFSASSCPKRLVRQCENTDPRTNLTTLNSLIVHASEGSGEALGPCGTRWASPFEGMGSEQALAALPVLLQQQPTDLNAVGADGMLPADVAVRWGSERVAAALAELGAVFLPRHEAEARRRGHTQLAGRMRTLL